MAEWHSLPEEDIWNAALDDYVSDDPYWKQDVFEDIWDEPSEDEENDEADREANFSD